jgi:hypothetical protein
MVESEVFEVGLISEGIPIIRRQYFKSEDMYVNPFLVGEILSSIQSFDLHDVEEIPQLIQVADYIVNLHRFRCGRRENLFLLYVICQVSTEQIRKSLTDLAIELQTFDNILVNWYIDTEALRNLDPVFDEIFLPFTS